MSDNKAISIVKGYDPAMSQLEALTNEGTDYSNTKGDVARQIAQLHPKRLALKIAEVITETDSTKTLRLVSRDGDLPPFQAGQYINLFLDVDGVSTARPYAISSPPKERDHLDITIKKIPNGFVANYLVDEARVGDCLSSTGPMGSFHYNPIAHSKELVFLAGGSGVAPALSMVKDFIARQTPVNFHLIYGSRSTDDVIFREQLQSLAAQHDFFTMTEVISEPAQDYEGYTGFINAELLKELVSNLDETTFYLCGPSVMYDFCLGELKKLEIPKRRIRVEANGAPKQPALLEGWPSDVAMTDTVTVTVRDRGEFKAIAGEPLLISLEKNGYTTENACRSGECSLCRTKIVEGTVFNPAEAKLRSSDRKFGWCHSCVAFPVSDIEILL